jgi:hypothetical protein
METKPMEKFIEEVEKYFSENNNLILTQGEVMIRKQGAFFMIDYLLDEIDGERYEKYRLHEQAMDTGTFLQVYGITSLEELQMLSEAKMWERYLAEAAVVIFTNGDGAEINFRLKGGKTMVYGLKLNYEGEVDRVLDKMEDFRGFVRENWEVVGGKRRLKVEG